MGIGRLSAAIQETGAGEFPMATIRIRSKGADQTTISLADGRPHSDTEKSSQAGGTTRIYGMILCKTEKFPHCFIALKIL